MLRRLHAFKQQLTNTTLAILFVATQVAFPLAASGVFVGTAQASPVCVNDTAGANDEPGQKDLTKLCVDYAGSPTTVQTTWQWDETGTNGANTMDACSLFDTDGDGNINYSVCVTTTGDPATMQTLTTYSCGDDKIDRCTSPVVPVSSGTTSCNVTQVNIDPFPTGSSSPKDTQGTCTVQLSTVGGATARLIDVCSYPSEQPNSDPSDCVIAQPKAGKLEVVKDLVPASDSGLFNLQVDGTTKAANVGDNGSTGEVVVPEGNHSVGETAGTNTNLAGYTSSISCRDLNGTGSVVASGNGTSLANVPVPDGSDIICTITNTASGSITIIKDAQPNSAQDFAFTATGSGVSNFSLDDDADPTLSNTKAFTGLAAGSYSFTEAAVTGWDQFSIDCGQAAGVSVNGATVTINLTAGQNVTCTYVNKQRGTVTVHKVTDPANDPTQFSITASGTGNIAGNATRTLTTSQDVVYDVSQGTYGVSEQVPAGWTQSGNTCTSLVIDANNLSRTCTITNTKLSRLTITKDAQPNDAQDFSFLTTGTGLSNFSLDDDSDPTLSNTKQFIDLAAGSYSVTEQSVSGWQLTGLTCSGTNSYTTNGSMAQVTLVPGDVVSCAFTNTKLGSISGSKFNDLNGNGVWDQGEPALSGWTINLTLGQTSTQQVTDQNGNYMFIDLLPGSYSLAEVLQTGWTQTVAPGPVNLSAGQNSTGNDFGNFQHGSIGGYKFNDHNGNGVEDQGDEHLSGWTITLKHQGSQDVSTVTDQNGNYSFTDLVAGTYTLCETLQTGWVQTYPANNACHTVVIDQSGETNPNTKFGNQGRGSIQVIKNVDTDGDGDVDLSNVNTWAYNIDGSGGFATGSTQSVAAGQHTVAEVQQANYHVTASSCSGETTPQSPTTSLGVTVSPGENVVCTFVNTRDTGTLVLVKHVVNNNGGTLTAANFTLHVTQNNSDVAGSPVAGSEAGTNYTLLTGTYNVSENTPPAGYQQTSIVCDGQASSSVTVTSGTTKTCTITNDDIAPQLTVIKHVINDNSGTSSASAFTMNVTGTNVAPSNTFPGNEAGTTVTLNAGSYNVTESGPTGYNATLSTDCSGSIAIGQTKTCTITNNDIPHPGINVVKSGPTAAHEGDVVTYTFTVTNTGDTTLGSVAVNDSIAGGATYVSGDTNGNTLLDRTETWIFTKNYTIPASQIANVVNTATACGLDPDQTQVCDTDTHTLDVLHPGITVVKSGPLYAYEGQLVGYTFVVTNTGDTTLFNVGISDDIATNEVCDSTTLAPLTSTNCAAIYIIPTPQIGDVTNTVIASGTDVLGQTVTDTDNHTLDVLHPNIFVFKSGPAVAHEGDTVTYNFAVITTGDIALSSTAVSDSLAGNATFVSGDTNANSKLDSGEVWLFTASYLIPTPQTDNVVNTATACGLDPLQTQLCDTDNHTLDVLHPAINVVKSGPATASPGDQVTYTFTVTNTGDTPLDGVTALDSIAGAGTFQSGDTNGDGKLDLTETWIFTATYTIPANQTANVDNTVTACGSDTLQLQVCDTDTHHLVVLAKIVVTKYNDLDRSGTYDPNGDTLGVNEKTLPGWEMVLVESTQTTGADGTITFSGVTPDQGYGLSENQQEGWILTDITCTGVEGSRDGDTFFFTPTPGQTVNCFVGNAKIPTLNITKSNNRPDPTTVGDTVTYTITVTVPEDSGAVFNTEVVDLPPANFIVNPDSTSAVVNHTDNTTQVINTTPNYGSPGLWQLGNLRPGDVVTISYQAFISPVVTAGSYPDIALAHGLSSTAQNADDVEVSCISACIDEENNDFVGTTVALVTPVTPPPTFTGEVLGTSILVNTGTPLSSSQFIIPSLLIVATLLVNRATSKRSAKKGANR